jgi:hypothetical protein
MSTKKTPLKIFLMKRAWVVQIPDNLWEKVSKWCRKDKGYYFNKKYSNKHRIFTYTLGHLMDLIKKISEISWDTEDSIHS